MGIQKCQANGSWASMDQVSSASVHHRAHGARAGGLVHRRLAANAQTICAAHEHIFHSRKSWTETGPPELAAALPLHRQACSRLQLPSHPYPGCISPCWAWRAGPLCHHLHQSSASGAGNSPEQPRQATFANKEIKLILQMLTFYRGPGDVCCSCTWTSGAGELRENCNFPFKKKYFRIRTLQLKKSKLSDNLIEDYCWSKHIE